MKAKESIRERIIADCKRQGRKMLPMTSLETLEKYEMCATFPSAIRYKLEGKILTIVSDDADNEDFGWYVIDGKLRAEIYDKGIDVTDRRCGFTFREADEWVQVTDETPGMVSTFWLFW